MPYFSVIIPTYNRLSYLPQTLQSVWDQEFQDFEVIVVDDGSDDGSYEWLKQQTAPIRVVRQQNSGPGAARNLGARNASGEYVAFLDSDDLWFPWTLATYAEIAQRFDRPALIASRYESFDKESDLTRISQTRADACWFADYLLSAPQDFSVGSGTVAIRRDALRPSGGFLEDRLNAEDHDLIMRLGEKRGFVQIVEPIMLAWRRHPGSESSDNSRTAAGVLRLLHRENEGAYPGGKRRSRERHEILSRHARAAAMTCLSAGQLALGWNLYRETFLWHVGLRRWKFLLGFPLLIARAALFYSPGKSHSEESHAVRPSTQPRQEGGL